MEDLDRQCKALSEDRVDEQIDGVCHECVKSRDEERKGEEMQGMEKRESEGNGEEMQGAKEAEGERQGQAEVVRS